MFRRRRPQLARPDIVQEPSSDTLMNAADAQRDRGRYALAAALYVQASVLRPQDPAIHIQCGHMLKEDGQLDAAEEHYEAALRLAPEDADLALQLGHFYKVAGRQEASEAAYRRALALRPGWDTPADELARLAVRSLQVTPTSANHPATDNLAPELFPRPYATAMQPRAGLHIRRLGARQERTRWGVMPTLRGVEAIRGFCVSDTPIALLQIRLRDTLLHQEAILPPSEEAPSEKYVFNVWLDFSDVPQGVAEIEIRLVDRDGRARQHRDRVVVATALREADHAGSDAVIELAPSDPRTPEAQIRARPSEVRAAMRSVLAAPPRRILVMRTDQLGDLVTSIPALLRLRQLLPEARLVGLLTTGNADLARTLDMFDEIIVADFPDDPVERRRIMPPDTQEQLRQTLSAYRFDIALDLAESAVSRPLLLLSGARFLYGFHDRDWPWLTAGFEGSTHDPRNGLEMAPQSTKVTAMIERLGSTLASRAQIIRRRDLTRAELAPLELDGDTRYAVLHSGARIAFSRWPYYAELAALLLENTDLAVVLLTDDPEARWALPPQLARARRFQLLDRPVSFDRLDALLSFCTVFVGNDSGPKHLAALRGVPVVSLHSSTHQLERVGPGADRLHHQPAGSLCRMRDLP